MEKNRDGRCSGVYFGNVCAKRICKRLSILTMYLWNAFRCNVLIDRKIFNKRCKLKCSASRETLGHRSKISLGDNR